MKWWPEFQKFGIFFEIRDFKVLLKFVLAVAKKSAEKKDIYRMKERRNRKLT